MPIQSVTAYRVGELVFPTIQEAQKSELIELLAPLNEERIQCSGAPKELTEAIADSIIEHTDEIVAILTCQPKANAPRKPRSDIGKKRAAKSKEPAMV